MTDFMLVLFRGIGAFYVLAALLLMNAMVMDRLMDQALAALTLKPVPAKERLRRWLWIAAALCFGTGGAALVVLNLWAVPLFLAGAATQIAYLLWARNAFAPEDEAEAKGRQQTLNATVIYLAVTSLVCWLGWAGHLQAWSDPWVLVAPATGLLLVGVLVRHRLQPQQRGDPGEAGDDYREDEGAVEPVAPPSRVRLEPRWGEGCLRDADTGEQCDADLLVPSDLADRIWRWSLAFHADDERADIHVRFLDQEQEQRHRAEGAAIVAELVTVLGEGNVEGPVYPRDVRYGPEPGGDGDRAHA